MWTGGEGVMDLWCTDVFSKRASTEPAEATTLSDASHVLPCTLNPVPFYQRVSETKTDQEE